MGTNYYRIPTHEEMESRKRKLSEKIMALDISPDKIENGFRTEEYGEDSWQKYSPWEEFREDSCIHLGKRSMGWKFLWNFHDKKYYKDKEELFSFIRSGRIIDEYGEEIDQEEFIKMSVDWCQPNGLVVNSDYDRTSGSRFIGPKYWDLDIEGLRVSTSTDFC
jgi:hypothetical protein